MRELVAYACSFTGDDGSVRLVLRHRAETLRVTVHDTHPATLTQRAVARSDP
ncbi:hypothetical protein ACFV0C_12210 [Streptomyces sp. NPDC059568]|uniref:hypothetical protein n=1 Tax=Streptomyces sp. NPDC059568 TaxID=3346868 RepID=UPI00369F9F65